MNRKFVLILSVVLAFVALLLLQMYKSNVKKELGVDGKSVLVLVAAEDLSPYSVIDKKHIRVQEYPAKWAPPRHMKKDMMEDVIGQTTTYAIPKGQAILSTDLASTQSDAQLSRIITPRMRALALPVDKVNSFGGLLRPKDHVDVLGTFQKPGEGDVETVTLLQNVAVLAVGTKLGSGNSGQDDGKKGAAAGQARSTTVTVLVTPEEAELLVFAQDRGRLSLTMRNEEDVNTEMELAGKNFADIFRPEVRKAIQRTRDETGDGINIIKAAPKGR